jgi:hypothetical protein
LEIYHQGFISYHQLYSANMYNFDISISYKSSFFLFTNYKSDIFHFASFSRCVSPLCLPFLSPRCVSPVCLTVFGSKSSSQPFRLSAKKEQTDGNKMKQNETERFSRSFRHFSPVYKIEGVGSEHLEPLGSISRTASVSSNARPQGSAVAAIGLCGLKWGVLGLRPF